MWAQIDLNKQVNSLTDEELEKLVKAIESKRGCETRKDNRSCTPPRNKENLIIQYLIEGYGWLRKTEAINLVEKDIVDAVIVKRQNGYVFLRSRPDSTKTNILDK
jgi:hypothetical protein